MSKLLLMRHGKSVGNENNIIQGVSDFALTSSGKRDVERLVSENISKFDDYERIISSDLKRAVQTADILKEKVNKKVEYDSLVREVSAGILDGVRKKDASEKYPYYYDIWNSRGDLDNIPLAETGDELQSRVLMFLEQYMDNDKNDIIGTFAEACNNNKEYDTPSRKTLRYAGQAVCCFPSQTDPRSACGELHRHSRARASQACKRIYKREGVRGISSSASS